MNFIVDANTVTLTMSHEEAMHLNRFVLLAVDEDSMDWPESEWSHHFNFSSVLSDVSHQLRKGF